VIDLFSPGASFAIVGAAILGATIGYKAFATPALLADPTRRDWLHAFAAAVLSTFAVLIVLITAAIGDIGDGNLLTAFGAALVSQVVVVGAVYRSVLAGLVLVVGAQLASVVLAISLLLHPLILAVALTAWGFWLLDRDRVQGRARPHY